MWSDRCDTLHGTTTKDNKAKIKEKLRLQIRHLYNKRDTIDKEHHDIFSMSVEDLCNRQSIQYLRSWVNSYYTAENYTKKERANEHSLIKKMKGLTLQEIAQRHK